MPDKRAHRGPHPDDARLFASDALPALRAAVNDFCWLLGRGYASVSALKIVGDRYALNLRQRIAVGRCACSDKDRDRREQTRVELEAAQDRRLFIDGYNVLTSVEAALAGGVILCGHDGCYRDLASVHGTWRRVQETVPAAELLGDFLQGLRIARPVWHFDSPVSNSGRLKTLLRQTAEARGWDWDIQLVPDPDPILAATDELVATADSGILNRCRRWVNLARAVIDQLIPTANIVDLSSNS